MKGPVPIEIPEFFTVQWYRSQKECKKTDKEIANELFISIPSLAKWKKKIGWEPDKLYKLMCGRKRSLDPLQIRRMKEQGLSNYAIAEQLDVSIQAIHYWVKAL
jgi:DNA-binding CsgD family transcriptional regulator